MITGLLSLLLFVPPFGLAALQWREVDLRGLETTPGGVCTRAWLEERALALTPSSAKTFVGSYSNHLHTIPLVTLATQCAFAPPNTSPFVSQVRFWEVRAKAATETSWTLRGEPRPGLGNVPQENTEPLDAELRREVDGVRMTAGARGILLRSPRPLSESATSVLRETLRLLHSGGCLKAWSSIGGGLENVTAVCAAHRQMEEVTGPFVSIAVDDAIEVDRIAAGVLNRSPDESLRDQRGVLFVLRTTYERVVQHGGALLVEEGSTWRVLFLW